MSADTKDAKPTNPFAVQCLEYVQRRDALAKLFREKIRSLLKDYSQEYNFPEAVMRQKLDDPTASIMDIFELIYEGNGSGGADLSGWPVDFCPQVIPILFFRKNVNQNQAQQSSHRELLTLVEFFQTYSSSRPVDPTKFKLKWLGLLSAEALGLILQCIPPQVNHLILEDCGLEWLGTDLVWMLMTLPDNIMTIDLRGNAFTAHQANEMVAEALFAAGKNIILDDNEFGKALHKIYKKHYEAWKQKWNKETKVIIQASTPFDNDTSTLIRDYTLPTLILESTATPGVTMNTAAQDPDDVVPPPELGDLAPAPDTKPLAGVVPLDAPDPQAPPEGKSDAAVAPPVAPSPRHSLLGKTQGPSQPAAPNASGTAGKKPEDDWDEDWEEPPQGPAKQD